MKKALILLMLAFTASAGAANVTVAKVPGWKIIKGTDGMTNKTSCSATNTKYPNVWLKSDRIVIMMKGKGGVNASQHRFDQDPDTSMALRMTSDSADFWRSMDMDRILGGKRLRVRISPMAGNIVDFDIDLTTAKAAHSVLTGIKCR